MPRAPRIWFPEALYHLTIRGDNREPIFFADADYRRYLKLLSEAKQRYGCQLFAYALMTNHVHLMVQTGSTHPISKFMQLVNTAYTVYMNWKYQRVGHIFQGRYHSILVEKESYALELTRYIHLNPVRAGMVRAPQDYPWSSYRAYTGMESNPLVDAELMLDMIDLSKDRQREFYAQFVIEGISMRSPELNEEILASTRILGSPGFLVRVKEGWGQTPSGKVTLGV